MNTILEARRLRLRALEVADLDFIAAQLADPEVMRYWPRPQTRDEAAAWIRRQQERYERDGFGYWLALDRATSQPIGQIGLLAQEVDGRAEVGLGYIIHRPYWRQGYAAEGAGACRDWAFRTLAVPRVIALVRPENVPSQGVARTIGMTPTSRTVFAGFEHLVFAQTRDKPSRR